MKLPSDAIIPSDKLTGYLLAPREKNDKSRFLARVGFTQDNPDALERAIRQLIRDYDAEEDRTDEYGTFYKVSGIIIGSIGRLSVTTIWLYSKANKSYRFITLKPNKL